MFNSGQFTDFPIFFITPDIKRGLGPELILPKYYVICSSYDPLINLIRRNGGRIFCLEEEIGQQAGDYRNSGQLLSHPKIKQFIRSYSKNSIPNILFFKPNLKLDLLCQTNKYNQLANRTELNELFENKINFFYLVQKALPAYNPPGQISLLTKTDFHYLQKKFGLPFVVQFGHGWAGKTTHLINSEDSFLKLKKRYQDTQVKISKFIDGLTILNNCCIYNNTVLISPPAIQLSGHKILSRKNTTTCGRQWPATGLSQKIIQEISHISNQIGNIMNESGFRGYFGLDFILDKHGKLYLSENNARLTASSPFYTKLELNAGRIPLLLYHLASFLETNLAVGSDSSQPLTGSQMVIRSLKIKETEIKKSLPDGIYKIADSTFRQVDSRYDLDRLKEKEFIFLSSRPGKIIGLDEEIARLELKDIILDQNYKIKSYYNNLIRLLRKQLK